MADAVLQLVIRTPHAVVVDEPVVAARLTTETGLVGLRPRGEPMVLVVDPGLVVLRRPDGTMRFSATAGGLLHAGREHATLYTPHAVVGDSEPAMLEALDELDSALGRELVLRRQLGELEQRIIHELGARPHAANAATRATPRPATGPPSRSRDG